MNTLFRFKDWPLRAKMVMLLVAASLLPLAVATLINIDQARERMLGHTAALLTARGDQLLGELDTFHRGYQRSVDRIAHLPRVLDFYEARPEDSDRLKAIARTVLEVWPASDTNIRGVGILDSSGTVKIATEVQLIGLNLSYHSYVQEALSGVAVISDIHLAEPQAGYAPTIAYLAPVYGPGQTLIGLVVIWVRATALWDVMKRSNELAGPGSFAVMFDHQGIRVAHTYNEDIIFHPGGRLAATTVESLVAEGRFGTKTRELLEDVRAFPEQFDRSLSAAPDEGMFRGFAPVNRKWNYGVARRFETVPWTVFYMIPEDSLNAQTAQMTREKSTFAGVIMLIALLTGALFAAVILKPIASLSTATESIAGGDLAARVPAGNADELGWLGTRFNAMAGRIEAQATALQKARDELELRVQERTAELVQTTRDLELENAERKRTEQKLQAQLERLDLLHQITRAIGERQDLKSIFQVVIRSLEDHLPIDFGCVCLHDQEGKALTVTSVGIRSKALAMELAMTEQSRVDIDQNGLSRCIRGELVYEPDISQVKFPFPQRLARGGLGSMVAAPLLVESHVFGMIVAARRESGGFSSGECEFLRQLSGHVALAAHQSRLYAELQQSNDELRQTQLAVMQQERLRALGQMASGIAHNINNAISPITLYAEMLLEKEQNLSASARDHLVTIARAIDDVTAIVARMREFYRQREPQLMLAPVHLNHVVQQVVDFTRARWSDMPQQRGIVIKMVTELAPELPDIMGAEGEIRETLTNLIFNAVDAVPEGGTLTIRTSAGGSSPGSEDLPVQQQVHLAVTDSGVGMDEDTRRRCMEPFFTTKDERGTGLGLAMVYGVVKRHSADIKIESVVGKGTTVRLSFPVPVLSVAVPAQTTIPRAVPSRMRILIVDDDPLLIKALRDALETDRHMVIAANGGQEGIDAFHAAEKRNEPFAVVITDLGMPHVDGRKVASAVKQASPSTPVILLTGWGQRLVVEGDVPSHVDHVLSKPPKLSELREALARFCRRAEVEDSPGPAASK